LVNDVISEEKIFVIGGTTDGNTGLNDVWYSENGIDWQLATGNAGFSGRWGHTYINSYLIGGTENGTTGLSDVWERETDDFINWKLLTVNAGFSGRWGHAVESGSKYSTYIYVIGGKENNTTYLNDVWRSRDGKNWTKIMDGNFGKRAGHSLMFFSDITLAGKNVFRMIGGYDGANYFNQICDTEYK